MKLTLSLLLVGAFFVGTAYAPKTPAKSTTPAQQAKLEENYQKAKLLVEGATWPTDPREHDHVKPNMNNRTDVIQAATCLPVPKGQRPKEKWSNHAHRCIQQ